MKTFMVYLVNKQPASKTRIGTLVERRGTDRGNNIVGLMKLAAIRFKESSDQTIQIDFRGILVEL